MTEIQLFSLGWEQSCQTFVMEKDILFVIRDTEQNLLLLQVYLITSLKRQSTTNMSVPLSTRCADILETYGELLANNDDPAHFYLPHIFLLIPEGVTSLLSYLEIPK